MNATGFLSPALERSFFEDATEMQMIDYLQKRTVYVGTERWLIANASKDVLEELFRQQPLAPENEEMLVRMRNEKILQMYIMRYPFSPPAEKLMVDLEKEDTIYLYQKIYGQIKEGA